MRLIRSWERHLLPALLLGALALFFSASVAMAQRLKELPPAPPPPKLKPKPTPTPVPESQELDIVRVTSNLVIVPVSVTDARGQPVLGLKATDFRIEEEGRPQEIAQIGDPEQVPLDIAILLDVSSSVSSRFDFEQQAATRFLRQVLKPIDTATVFAIGDQPLLVQTHTTAEIAAAKLMMIKAASGPSPTAFYDSVVAASRYLAANTPPQHRRVIVVISDGEDNFSNNVRDVEIAAYKTRAAQDADGFSMTNEKVRAIAQEARDELHRKAQVEVLREVQRADAAFYSINPSGESLRLNKISVRGQQGMQMIAEATGGNSFVPENPDDLDPVFRQITAELRAQYLLQYYSNSETAKGQFRRITVGVPAHSELHIRARQGYYPKK
jgi:Ca-activated chloride channel family protein